jgi:hypothetical protein
VRIRRRSIFGLARGRCAPLQVIDGNYERMKGVCPWWDAMKARGAH